jgi:hypothetical protein
VEVISLDAEVNESDVGSTSRRRDGAVEHGIRALAPEVPHVRGHLQRDVDRLVWSDLFTRLVREGGARRWPPGAAPRATPRPESESLLLGHARLPSRISHEGLTIERAIFAARCQCRQ